MGLFIWLKLESVIFVGKTVEYHIVQQQSSANLTGVLYWGQTSRNLKLLTCVPFISLDDKG